MLYPHFTNGQSGDLPKVTQLMGRAGISTHLQTTATHPLNLYCCVWDRLVPCSSREEQGTQVCQQSLAV